jgi:cytochrome c oxidase accessory protein FixG
VGFFTPIRELGSAVGSLSTGPWESFWILFYGFATYGNAGWMREQVCKYMCPYARFQSAMFDRDTLIVTYDAERGEPRGAGSKSKDRASLGLGSCVDCGLCVQVCPTGIDIRNGLQYECIGCAACIDACDHVMDRTSQPRGLIRYSTNNALAQHLTRGQMWRHVARPRVLIYTAVLGLIVIGTVAALALRVPLKVDVIRDRGALAREVEDGRVENVYRLQVMNTTEAPQRYEVSVAGLPGLQVASDRQFDLAPASTRTVVLRLQADAGVPPGAQRVTIEVRSTGDTKLSVREKTTFLGLRR